MMKEMTFGQLGDILRRRAVLLLAIPFVLTALFAAYLYRFKSDVYTAEAVLYVLDSYTDSSDNTRYDTSVSAQLAADYKVLIGKEPFLDRCAQALGAPNLDDVSIDIYSENGTRVLDLAVTGADPEYCARVANAVSETFVTYIRELTHEDGLSIALEAQVPAAPSGPRRLLYTGVFFAGVLLFCVSLAVVAELAQKKLRTEEDVAALGLPVLARIDSCAREMKAFFAERRRDGASLLEKVPVSTQESVKMLSSNVRFAGGETPYKTLMLTSAVSAEGKSSLAVLLAASMAREHKKVLIVDLDFRNPSVARLLRARGKYDLTDYLRAAKPLDAVIRRLDHLNLSFIDNMHGDGPGMNVIQSAAFDRFLGQVRERFDMVIFDVPPVGLFADAAVLAPKVDATLLVVGSGRPKRRSVARAVDQLNKARANLIGVALNFARGDQQEKMYYSKYYGYGARGKRRYG